MTQPKQTKSKIVFAELEKETKPRLRSKVVDVEQWGGEVTIKELAADQYEALKARLKEKYGGDWAEKEELAFMHELLSETLYDSNDNPAKLEFLKKQSLPLLKKLFRDAIEINGIGAAASEATEKN